MAFVAHKYEEQRCMNAIVDEMVAFWYLNYYTPASRQIKATYARLPAHSAIRRMLIDHFCNQQDPKERDEDVLDFPSEFFYDIWANIPRTYLRGVHEPITDRLHRYHEE